MFSAAARARRRSLCAAVLQVLVLRVGVDGRHQAALDAERLVQHLRHRREAVGRARRVGDDRLRAVVQRLVDAEYDGEVVAGRRRGDDDLLRAALVDVLAGLLGLGEQPGRLDDDVDAEVLPRQGARAAALSETDDRSAVDRDAVVDDLDLVRKAAQHAVVLQQVRDRRGVTEVVVGDDLDVVAAGERRAEVVAPDPAEAVDAYPGGHAAPLDECLYVRQATRAAARRDGSDLAVAQPQRELARIAHDVDRRVDAGHQPDLLRRLLDQQLEPADAAPPAASQAAAAGVGQGT